MARVRSNHSQSTTWKSPENLDLYLGATQRLILILAIFVVPLIVLPESSFIDITSVPKTSMLRIFGSLQAGVLLSRVLIRYSSSDGLGLKSALSPIRESKPATLILSSVAAVVIVSLISTLFSIVPHQSWWGRTPSGFESGEFSALMYVVLMISAFISTRESSRRPVLWRALAVIGVLASLIGFLQHLGLSPLDISSTQGDRVTGTNGNPIFFGAMLVVLTPITIGVLFERYHVSGTELQKVWLAAIAVSSFLISASLIATLSRGPLLGTLIGGIIAVILVVILRRSKISIAPVIVLVIFTSIGGLSSLLITFADTTSTPTPTITSTLGKSNSVNIRLQYWSMSSDMAVSREPVPFAKKAPKIIRWLFGYGPDSFRYAGTYYSDNVTFTRRLTAAHSDPINRLAEQGFLGFLAWVSLWTSLLYGVIVLIRRHRSETDNTSTWIVIAIAMALTGRFIEQSVGSPTPGGTLVFWLIIGGLLTLLIVPAPDAPSRNFSPSSSPIVTYAMYSGLVIIAAVFVLLAWEKGASYLIANQTASFLNRPHIVPVNDAIKRLESAVILAPDNPFYLHGLADIEFGRAKSTSDENVRTAALTRAYEYELRAHEINPIAIDDIYDLAFAAWELGNAGRPELRQTTLDLYERLTILGPSDSLARERLKTLSDFLSK
ncbi:MAG: O-antigen ligase family protein [Chloroflexi bacterium]|nr:O-antigen ligase family protein [Chloroflexota bacterium]